MPRLTTVRRTIGFRVVLGQAPGQGADQFAIGVAGENLEAGHAPLGQTAPVSVDGASLG